MLKKYGIPMLIGVLGVVIMCGLARNITEKSLKFCFPGISYQSQESLFGAWITDKVGEMIPFFAYTEKNQVATRRKDCFEIKKIRPVELLTMMEFENLQEKPSAEETSASETVDGMEEIQPLVNETENINEITAVSFVPHTLQRIVDMEVLADYETLLNEFYIVDNVAKVSSEVLNATQLNNKDLRISKETEGPQILIYHTHSQEGFADSVPGDDSTTILGVGEHLAGILRNNYGYEVIHHMGKYDVETRDNAYSCALPEVERILKENPSIKVVIDLHRDAVADVNNKLVMDLDGRPTARFMFFNGVSCGKKTGNINYLYNPNLEENLAFSFQLKKVAEEYYPGLTRKNYINAYRYNMHLCGRTTLIELGAQNNTLEEVMNACDPIAHILDMVLSGA